MSLSTGLNLGLSQKTTGGGGSPAVPDNVTTNAGADNVTVNGGADNVVHTS